MKKTLLAVCAATLALASCGLGTTNSATTATTTPTTTTTTSTASTANSLLSSVLGSVLGNVANVSQENLVGNWTYVGSECKFESENLLVSAGGDLAATQIETKLDEYLAKIGITKGVLTMNITSDNKCTMTVKGTTISSGTYTYDAENKKITISSTLGYFNVNAWVVFSNGNLCLLFDADKLLQIVNAVASKLGSSSSTVSTVTSLLGDVQGMKVGFSMSK